MNDLRIAGLAALLALCAPPALGEPLPAPAALEASGAQAVTLTVVEPHESAPGRPVEVAYRAFPAAVALAAALGPDWAQGGRTIAFHALDGYVSRIEAARLASGEAWLAFARADGKPFTVDNAGQDETNVPLGPWYLIWDDLHDPALIAAGARDWPYQADAVSFAPDPKAALRPPGFDPALEPGLEAAKANCLTCHQVNGFGGDKVSGDLAQLARAWSEADFTRRTLAPSAVDPKATMPALMPDAPQDARRAAAATIYAYLARVPIVER